GFYITKYENGSLNSFEAVHKKLGNMQTAFSYNWFLLEILAQFYFVNKYATDTLRKIIVSLHNLDIKTQSVMIEDTDIKTVIHKLNGTLSQVLFEDEYEKPISQVEYSSNELIIKRPADHSFLKRFKIPPKLQYETILSGDGTTCSFGFPYLGQR
ncbi:MAG TPA: hypothetical protein VM577_07625, partial [Anaerovoracaceae bacterium]|nr:hypothetical protein [Anaerovoracaceae bacterium]